MFARREGDLPIVVGKTFPPIELDHALEAEVDREVADAPGHDADFWMRQTAQGGFMEMIEMRVREQDQIDGREVFDFQAGAFDAFEEKQPVGKIRVDEHVEVRELNEEGRVADPGDGDFAVFQFREDGPAMLAGAAREQCLPDHLMKKGARIEMFGGREVFERLGQRLSTWARLFWHMVFVIAFRRYFCVALVWRRSAAFTTLASAVAAGRSSVIQLIDSFKVKRPKVRALRLPRLLLPRLE
jgi:hypothetical protein